MSLPTTQIIDQLNDLANLNQASELGFTHAAEHVRSRGLKIYLRHYAAQRAQFAQELRKAIVQLGGKVTPAGNPIAVMHRGLIDILATLTIGRMNQAYVVVKESLHGEHVVLCRYRETAQTQYPPAIRTLLDTHTAQIKAAYDQLSSIIAPSASLLLIQLFERADSAQTAVNHLVNAGVAANDIHVAPMNQFLQHEHTYRRQLMLGNTVACAMIGTVVGLLLGLLLGLPLEVGARSADLGGLSIPLILCAVTGFLSGSVLGLLIRQGASEDDAYYYETGLRDGSAVVSVRAANVPAKQVYQILEMQRNQERQATMALAGAAA